MAAYTKHNKFGTLDNNHKNKLLQFNESFNNIKNYELLIDQLKDLYETTKNDVEKINILDQIEDFQTIINNIKNFIFEAEYYNSTFDILLEYYDKSFDKNKAELYDRYINIVDKSSLRVNNTNNVKQCELCGEDKAIRPVDGCSVCKNCGEITYINVDSDKIKYIKDIQQVEQKIYSYKRSNHLSELLNQFQGKETTDIDEDIFTIIQEELKKNKLHNINKVKKSTFRMILKKCGLTKYYEHIPHIINKLTGKNPPTIPRELDERIKQMFKDIQEPFSKHKPKDRKNMINYNYILHKLCQILRRDDIAKQFPLLKCRNKLREQDTIWKNICCDLNWEFISSN